MSAQITAEQPITRVLNRMALIADGKDPDVKPGKQEAFTAACCAGDTIRQGDLYLRIVDKVPTDYTKVEKMAEINRQLVPGNTIGAKHALESLEGVEMYLPNNWTEESLLGPVMILSADNRVLHPTHGAVFLVKDSIVECGYQRSYDEEQKRERRARD